MENEERLSSLQIDINKLTNMHIFIKVMTSERKWVDKTY